MFHEEADAVTEKIRSSENVKTCLSLRFLNGMDTDVLCDASVIIDMPCEEAELKLLRKYGALQRPISRHVRKVITFDEERS